ncbi:pyridoxamine 5'-phosphate oxidase family protein [Ceratobasidium sp. AG-Ba]|nr:pyridoxamine 5'-phosphate oxidase family protein [Ceratobasidium sp. AG-Ba]
MPPSDSTKLRVTSHNQYQSPSRLSPDSVLPDPLDQFREWFKAAAAPAETDPSKSVVREPEAMAVSTCSSDGVPSTRFVLLKQADSKGFVFYTNYTSRKSKELLANPVASIALYWREVHRQVRAVGRVEQVDAQESDEYFASRPLGSRRVHGQAPRVMWSKKEKWTTAWQKSRKSLAIKYHVQSFGEDGESFRMKLNFGRDNPVVCTIVSDILDLQGRARAGR